MESMINIPACHSGGYFSIFYLLAYLICFFLLSYLGHRHHYPQRPWILMVAAGMVLFIVGTKLFSYSREEWLLLFSDWQFSPTSKKTVLGGLLLLVPGMAILKRLLNFRFPVFNLLAVVIPIVMAVQRVGCLLSGCCFGKPTHLPWGLSYGKGHLPYHVHLNQGLIEPGDELSLAIHPNQAYHILFCLALAWVVWRSRNYWKKPFSQFLFSIMMYGVFRFFMEFLRDPAANFQVVELIWGLRQTQWLIFITTLTFLLIILWNEKKKGRAENKFVFPQYLVQPSLLLVILIIPCAGWNWFTPIEKVIIWTVIISVLLSYAFKYFYRITMPGYRWVTPVMMILGLVFMSQQLYIPADKSSKVVYNDYSFGVMFSEYSAEIRQYWGSYEGCFGTAYSMGDPETRRYRNMLGGFQWSVTEMYQKKRRYNFQVNVFLANDRVQSGDGQYLGDELTFGFGPYFQYDGGFVGFGGGVQLGRLRYATINKSPSNMQVGEWENALDEFIVRPQFHFRLGPYDYAYVEVNVANHFPSSSPMPYYQVGIGSGLGKVDGTMVGVGSSEAGPYLKTLLPVSNKFFVGAFVSANFKGGNERKQLVSLSLKYRPRYDILKRQSKELYHESN